MSLIALLNDVRVLHFCSSSGRSFHNWYPRYNGLFRTVVFLVNLKSLNVNLVKGNG